MPCFLRKRLRQPDFRRAPHRPTPDYVREFARHNRTCRKRALLKRTCSPTGEGGRVGRRPSLSLCFPSLSSLERDRPDQFEHLHIAGFVDVESAASACAREDTGASGDDVCFHDAERVPVRDQGAESVPGVPGRALDPGRHERKCASVGQRDRPRRCQVGAEGRAGNGCEARHITAQRRFAEACHGAGRAEVDAAGQLGYSSAEVELERTLEARRRARARGRGEDESEECSVESGED